MKNLGNLPGLRALIRFTRWLWEPMVFTDPFANRVRPRLLSRTATPNTQPPQQRLPPRSLAPRALPYRALTLTN